MTESNNSKLLVKSSKPNSNLGNNLRRKFGNRENEPSAFELANSLLEVKRKSNKAQTQESNQQSKILVMKYKFIVALKKIKLNVVAFCSADDENVELDPINLDDPLTPLPPSISKKNNHHLLEFQNGEKYIILKSENALFVQNYIELFDSLYTLQNQMIRSDFNKSYEFALQVSKKLKIKIESPSQMKSKNAIVSEFWKNQIAEKINLLINQSKKIQVFLQQIKHEGNYFKAVNNSVNPRSRQIYPLCETDLLKDFLEFINASVENCIDQTGIVDKPSLELSRYRYNYEYGNYVLRFSNGKVLGHPPISIDRKQVEFFSADELFELENAISKFHQFYSGFKTIKSDLNEITHNPTLVELKKYPDKDTRELLFLQQNLEKFSKLFSLKTTPYLDKSPKKLNTESLLEFWTMLGNEIENFVPLSQRAKQMYNKFDIVINEAKGHNETEYPLFDLKILAELAIYTKNQIIKLKTQY